MSSAIIILAHPHLHRSHSNKALLHHLHDIDPAITVADLYEEYPDMHIDATQEQLRLTQHDTIILQFPFQWFSCPALLKEWLDSVFLHGWSFGEESFALEGKNLLCAITTGGTEKSYTKNGHNGYDIEEFLRPFEQTAKLCRMKYHPPFVLYGAHKISDSDLKKHAKNYYQIITGHLKDWQKTKEK